MTKNKNPIQDIYKKTIKFCFLVLFLNLAVNCAGVPPKEEYVLALTALENAKKAQVDKLQPKLSYRSKKFYELALKYYEERNYTKAKEYFIKTRFIAEKAELRARIKKYKNGEIVL